jgi:truncated hemoglobin YjbI
MSPTGYNSSGFHNQDRAHAWETDAEIHEEARVEAFMDMFGQAMRATGVDREAQMSMKQRAELILRRARSVSLEKRLYELAWFVRKTAR